MLLGNYTIVEFILLGLSNDQKAQVILFVIFLISYLSILIGNILIITLIITDTNLHMPMYFFLSNLTFLDLCFTTSAVPWMLRDLLSANKVISLAECATQAYFALSFGEILCILLAVMAYDQYVAICFPLHYTAIMNRMVCIRLAAGTWLCGFLLSIVHVALSLNIHFCGNIINYYVCEAPEIVILGCEKILLIEYAIFIVGVIILMTPITFIAVTYAKIIFNILKIASSAGRRKAFSTCESHMIVVTIFYGSAMTVYMKPKSSSIPGTDKVMAVFYGIVPPIINPVIYSFRNNNVKAAFLKFRSRYSSC